LFAFVAQLAELHESLTQRGDGAAQSSVDAVGPVFGLTVRRSACDQFSLQLDVCLESPEIAGQTFDEVRELSVPRPRFRDREPSARAPHDCNSDI
jgi:hypothetical protein